METLSSFYLRLCGTTLILSSLCSYYDLLVEHHPPIITGRYYSNALQQERKKKKKQKSKTVRKIKFTMWRVWVSVFLWEQTVEGHVLVLLVGALISEL